MQSFIQDHLASSGYPALFVLAFLAAMCIPIPSELIFGFAGALCSASFLAGSNAADQQLHLWAVIVVGTVATVCGASVAYATGRYAGRAFVDRYGKYVLLSHEDLDRAERLFGRWGDGLVAVGQLIPLLRAFVGFFAGVARVRWIAFIVLTTLGAAAWVSLISVIGYEAGDSWHQVLRWFGAAGYVIAALVVIALVVAFVHRWRRYHEAQARRTEV
ncbi:MAG TPA: DedA family protein [Acidimicrobiales bacterium]|nr:DedA family protein [Acidimicrobiales bacterium]